MAAESGLISESGIYFYLRHEASLYPKMSHFPQEN